MCFLSSPHFGVGLDCSWILLGSIIPPAFFGIAKAQITVFRLMLFDFIFI